MKITILIFFFILSFAFADLMFGFYSSSCPSTEAIVHQVGRRRFNQDVSITGGLLRLHFHDCFVRGCDAYILIDSTNCSSSGKDARPNQTVRGYELIDEARRSLEQACPSTVSCADIITPVTRGAVAMAGGPRYNVPTGRRDGLLSNPSEVKLPRPSVSVTKALQSFTARGLSLDEMVTLLRRHALGFAHCSMFQNRLSSFQGRLDPTMGPALDAKLVKICGSSTRPARNNPTVFLDQNTSFVSDNQFCNQILLREGYLASISNWLWIHPRET